MVPTQCVTLAPSTAMESPPPAAASQGISETLDWLRGGAASSDSGIRGLSPVSHPSSTCCWDEDSISGMRVLMPTQVSHQTQQELQCPGAPRRTRPAVKLVPLSELYCCNDMCFEAC